MFKTLFQTLTNRTFWDGFLYGLSGPMMMAVEPPRGPGFSPLPDLRRPRLSPEEKIERAWRKVGVAMWEAIDLIEEVHPIFAAQTQIAARR